MARIYLDWNATAPLRPEAREAAISALDVLGNPSSIHTEGRGARKIRESARDTIAGWLGVDREAVTFTSGGTEANALALTGLAKARPGKRFAVSAVEHPSVLETARLLGKDGSAAFLPVNGEGVLDLSQSRALLDDISGFTSVQAVNNETGAVHPVAEFVRLAKARSIPVHVDATQVPGRMAIPKDLWEADLITFSGHKIGAAKGVGILVNPNRIPLDPLITGGPQERGRRAGTENLPSIASFAGAVSSLTKAEASEIAGLQKLDEQFLALLAPLPVRLNTGAATRIPNTWNIRLDVEAEPVLQALDLEGVAASSGSACSSGSLEPSPVLMAMGLTREQAKSSLRISAGRATTADDVAEFIKILKRILSRQS